MYAALVLGLAAQQNSNPLGGRVDGVDIDGSYVVLLRGHVLQRDVICYGLATFDGTMVTVGPAEGSPELALSVDLVAKAMPVTGEFLKWFPGASLYIECEDDPPPVKYEESL